MRTVLLISRLCLVGKESALIETEYIRNEKDSKWSMEE